MESLQTEAVVWISEHKSLAFFVIDLRRTLIFHSYYFLTSVLFYCDGLCDLHPLHLHSYPKGDVGTQNGTRDTGQTSCHHSMDLRLC